MSCDPPEKPIDPMRITVGDMIFPGQRTVSPRAVALLGMLGMPLMRLRRSAVLDVGIEMDSALEQLDRNKAMIAQDRPAIRNDYSRQAPPVRTDADREALDNAQSKRDRKALKVAMVRAKNGLDPHEHSCDIWTGEKCDCSFGKPCK